MRLHATDRILQQKPFPAACTACQNRTPTTMATAIANCMNRYRSSVWYWADPETQTIGEVSGKIAAISWPLFFFSETRGGGTDAIMKGGYGTGGPTRYVGGGPGLIPHRNQVISHFRCEKGKALSRGVKISQKHNEITTRWSCSETTSLKLVPPGRWTNTKQKQPLNLLA